jgi:hypothetical protein
VNGPISRPCRNRHTKGPMTLFYTTNKNGTMGLKIFMVTGIDNDILDTRIWLSG